MVIAATIAMLTGAVLGTHYKVLVLVPAFAIGLTVILALSPVFDMSWLSVGTTALLFVTSLQIGYLTGGFLRIFFAGARQTSPQIPILR